ncbi:MAG TPA: serine/threonine-protein kinase, partial [Kofleriaceae bacterium]|nr:serine/threonine-protein kinase [Kofleriaceae bacterium]
MSVTVTEQVRAVWCCSRCGAVYHKDFPRCPIDGAEVVVVDRDPMLGSTVGQYQIDELIGEGGMGRVYLARHAHLPTKRYAFKVLLGDHSASPAMRTRFTREAERASQLDHANVARVVDFGQTQHGLPYIVMDYVDGPSLVTLIGDTPMPALRVVALAREICKGLEHAHAAGIVHRDLKPENILVTPGPGDAGGVPRLVDFGLALSIDQSDARLTETGMTMGTPAFAAPEQLSGKPIDHRADLYALGMTMFEMLTGGLSAVEGSVMEVVAARTARDAPRLRDRVPELAVPRALEDIVARLTRKRPGERFASAREVIDALDALDPRVLRGEVAEPPSAAASDAVAMTVHEVAAAAGEVAPPAVAAAITPSAPVPPITSPSIPVTPEAASRGVGEPAPAASDPALAAAEAS